MIEGNERSVRIWAAAAVVALVVVAAGCSSSSPGGSSSTTGVSSTTAAGRAVPGGVASVERTYTDTSRPTMANGDAPALDARTLATTIWYPVATEGSSEPDTAGGPWPLVLFSHGFSANPAAYEGLVEKIARAGYVVAAPTFPLSAAGSVGGPNTGDIANQPADASFVIDQVLDESAGAGDDVLAGLIDPDRVAAVGHSLGANSTLALVTNTCCRDDRVKAGVILAGTDQPMPGGSYEIAQGPPMLFVSGTEDSFIPYNRTAKIFNAAVGPKAMVTLVGGDHVAAASIGDDDATVVADAISGFLDAILFDGPGGLTGLDDLASDDVEVTVVTGVGATTTVSTLPEPDKDLHATADRTEGLRDGDAVTITWTGFSPGKQVSVLQCGPEDRDFAHSDACDFKSAKLLLPNPEGHGEVTLNVVAGEVGTSRCDADHDGCFILLNNGASTDPEDMFLIPITFAE